MKLNMNFLSSLSLKDRNLLMAAAFACSIACITDLLVGFLSFFLYFYVIDRYGSNWGVGKTLLSFFIGGFLVGAASGGVVA